MSCPKNLKRSRSFLGWLLNACARFRQSAVYASLLHSLNWKIAIPEEWSDYFEVTGRPAVFADDQRLNQRLGIRICRVMWFEKSIPIRPRTNAPVGIYTRDFSRQGTGFISLCEIYLEEQVRIVLPTFWVQVRVARTRRINSRCYEVGAILLLQHDPDEKAFLSNPPPVPV